jgi:hypothetical protein
MTIKAKDYDVLVRAVEIGVQCGITRMFKHLDADAMTQDEMRECAHKMEDSILDEICEWFTFDSDSNSNPKQQQQEGQ